MATSPLERSPHTPTSEQATPNIASTSETLSEHLSYPTLSEPVAAAAPVASSSTAAQTRTLLKDRLYVGNLHPSVDEYTLLQVFSKFGKINKLDFLFHKAGPLKGKPRGYAFVEYGCKDDAERALTRAHDKLLRGRKLVVTYANQAPLDSASGALGAGSKNRRAMSEVGKPTTLSLLKSAGTGRSNNATDAKIARMEAKLRQLEGASTVSAVGGLPGHPSLPPKPVAAAAAAATTSSPRRTPTHAPSGGARERSRAAPLPSLPIIPSTTHPPTKVEKGLPLVSSASAPARPLAKKSALPGIRIVKKN
ncbi:RNA-binding domain-containing protein [Lentinus brumalis]|uniref:Probable RNA-binding protein 18 n=1 Tax=Lentinus brumalis TaxID=2498619 RepID=A0A371CMX6_9APHY|nr:RNA-binding domain-containing protein [Polyporus brumalis]